MIPARRKIPPSQTAAAVNYTHLQPKWGTVWGDRNRKNAADNAPSP